MTINKFTLESKIHFSNGWNAFNGEGMLCDLDNAEYVDIQYDNCTDEYKKIADNEYQLISSN
jgi:hypothetical protein